MINKIVLKVEAKEHVVVQERKSMGYRGRRSCAGFRERENMGEEMEVEGEIETLFLYPDVSEVLY